MPHAGMRPRRAWVSAKRARSDATITSHASAISRAPVTHGPIQQVSWAYSSDARVYPFDPAASRALLDDAGWRDASGDGIRERDGRRFAFTLITQSGFAVREP